MNSHPDELSIFRILDASANRAAEGLRTLEEYARFVLEDRGLTELAKALRHDLTEALAAVPWRERLIARAVASDCGTTVSTPQEGDRDGLQAVVAAAAARVEQAFRCLEEYAKPIDLVLAVRAESLRYRAYSLAASLLLMRSRCERLADARLYLLISGETSELSATADQAEERFATTLRGLFSAGVDIIQLRDKAADDRRLYRLSRVGAEVARGLGKLFIVNDRADIARAAGAQGVHVGQDELPVEAVRRVVGSELLIGVSTHDVAQVRQALTDGADYIGCGPTFPGQTKGFAEYPGPEFLRAAAAETTLPAYAIGGITLDRLDEVLATGIHGVAVAHAILSAADPMAAARAWKDKM
ncbi:MAG: thiamine phosphate synthase [Planctomycetaceae bacterium]|nr:MAG: thiamine phosphate synthase [Planctomycetaceae bacterium]